MTKKTASKRLSLDLRTIALLDASALHGVAGGRPRNTVNMSVCFRQNCVSDYCGGSSGC